MRRRRWVSFFAVAYAATLAVVACSGQDPLVVSVTVGVDAGATVQDGGVVDDKDANEGPTDAAGDASVDASDAATCEADLATSNDHCGRCSHSCLGGGCEGGVCQPIALVEESAGLELSAISVHGDVLYWGTVNAGIRADLRRCSVANCAATTTSIAFSGDGGYYPMETRTTGIAADDAHVYFTNYYRGRIYRCPAGGCGDAGPEEFAVSGGSPDPIVVHGSDVYWANVGSGDSIQSCATGGCAGAPRTLTSTDTDGGRPLFPNFVIEKEYAYFTSIARGDAAPEISLDFAPGIYRVLTNANQAAPQNIARSLMRPQALVVVGTSIFFTDQRDALGNGALLRTSVASGQVSEHATNLVEPTSLIADGTTLYFIEHGAGTIRRCTSSTCATPTAVATEQGDPQGLTQDAVAVYWFNGTDNRIMRIAK